jgi:hypothetical protein
MLEKKFVKTKNTCKVTFQLPESIEAKKALVAGDFDGWQGTPLKKVKGVWKTTLDLETGREYQFRSLVNDAEWYNDWNADKYVPNNIDGDNSVVITYNHN